MDSAPVLVYGVRFVHGVLLVVVNHLQVPDTLWASTSGVD